MPLGLLVRVDGPIADVVALAQRAERAGVDSIHVIEATRDPFVPLAAIAAATERIELGTYVANMFMRTPQAAATAALALDDLSDGRFTLGVGAGNPHLNEWFLGVDSTRPMSKVRDYLRIVRAFVQGETSEETQVGGSVHQMQRRFVPPPPARRVPIVLAAAGPRMIELAAACSDGVGLGLLISPDYLRSQIRPRSRGAAESAGRDPGGVQFPMAALVSVDEDEERARAVTRRAIAGLFHPVPHPYYEHLMRVQGHDDVVDALCELAPRKLWADATAAVTDAAVDNLTITGSPTQCAARIRAYEGVASRVICRDLGGTSQDALFAAIAAAQ